MSYSIADISIPTWIEMEHLGHCQVYEQIMREWNRRTCALSFVMQHLWDIPYIQPFTERSHSDYDLAVHGTSHSTLRLIDYDYDDKFNHSTGVFTWIVLNSNRWQIAPRLLWDNRSNHASSMSSFGKTYEHIFTGGAQSRFAYGEFFVRTEEMLTELLWFIKNQLPLYYSLGPPLNYFCSSGSLDPPSSTMQESYDFRTPKGIVDFINDTRNTIEAHSFIAEYRLP